jgi:outer membrane immunogenic protein
LVKKLLLATVVAGAFATPAAAQDAFNGFRIEALTGYDSVGISVDEDIAGEDVSGNSSGIFYGVAAGYDVAVGKVVFGAEIELSDSTVDEEIAIDEVIEDVDVDATAELSTAEDIYLGARLGFAVAPTTLLYGKVGYSMASANLDAAGTIDGETGAISADLGLDGLRLGAGVEHSFGSNVYAKVEYRYTDYSLGDLDIAGEEIDLGDALDFIDSDRHQVLVGIGYRF